MIPIRIAGSPGLCNRKHLAERKPLNLSIRAAGVHGMVNAKTQPTFSN